ncbi:PAS domain S-box protein [Myxococcota bacterium]|nr:PAS domain S-box protein [Myxococcota bacterium]
MHFLDARTVIFLNILTDALCVAILFMLWRQNHRRFAGLGLWVGDFLFQTIGLLLIAFRDGIPLAVSVLGSNFFVMSGAVLGYLGLRRFLGFPVRFLFHGVLLAIFLGLQAIFLYVMPSIANRNLIFSAALLVVCGQCAALLLVQVQAAMRGITSGTGIIFLGFCLFSLFRIAIVLFSSGRDENFFHSNSGNLIIIIIYQLLLILLSYGMTLMVNRRLLAEIRVQEEKFSLVFQSSPSAVSLTSLSDGRILQVNDAFLHISGYTAGELLGRTTVELGLWEKREERDAVVARLARRENIRDQETHFRKKTGETIIGLFSSEVIMIQGDPQLISVIIDITGRKLAELERERLVGELTQALSEVKKLSGLLPICANCKKIRDDQGYWSQVETYIGKHTNAQFSHGICPDCAAQLYPEYELDKDS